MMKIKCNDGIVRRFSISEPEPSGIKVNDSFMMESICMECGQGFGIHDTKILKPRWKQHICNRLVAESKEQK